MPSRVYVRTKRSSRLGKTYEEIYGVEKATQMRKANSEGHLGEKNPNFGKHPTPATREKIGLKNLGKHPTPATREKNRLAHLGKPSGLLGKTYEEIYGVERAKELKEKIRFAHLGKRRPDISGPNCHLYRDGKSNEPYGKDFDNVCRLYIRERDDFMCQFPGCGKLENGKAFCVHHIDHNKHNNNPWDLILICRSCHSKEAIMFKKNPDETMNMFEDVLRARHIMK